MLPVGYKITMKHLYNQNRCIKNIKLTEAYSILNEISVTFPGNFPFLRMGMKGIWRCSAIKGPNKNPLDSNAQTACTLEWYWEQWASNSSLSASRASGLAITAKISLIKNKFGNRNTVISVQMTITNIYLISDKKCLTN